MNKHHKSTMTIMDFQKRYNTEEACRDALFKMRYPNGFHCPKCGCSKFCFINCELPAQLTLKRDLLLKIQKNH